MRSSRGRLSRLIRIGTFVIGAIAVVREMRTPAEQRQWHGTVGPVPYDFRFPTPSRVKDRLWNPDEDRILMPQVFGVGWSVNLGRVTRLLRS
jgi:Family of unknown function (DUF5808)